MERIRNRSPEAGTSTAHSGPAKSSVCWNTAHGGVRGDGCWNHQHGLDCEKFRVPTSEGGTSGRWYDQLPIRGWSQNPTEKNNSPPWYILKRINNICPRKLLVHTCPQQHCSQSPQSGNHPNVHQQKNGLKRCGRSMMEYYSARKRDEVLIRTATWMSANNRTFSERSYGKKATQCLIPLI